LNNGRSKRSSKNSKGKEKCNDQGSRREETHSLGARGTTKDKSFMPQNNEDDACKEGYKVEIMDRYYIYTIIHSRMGHELTSIPNVKNIRVSAPEKYSGEDNIKKFDTWLAELL
jgi:hypothetical protein